MQIGISTASFFSRFRTEDSLAYIGSRGIEHTEVFLDTFSEYEPDFAQLLRDTAAQNHTKIVSVHALSQQFEPQLFSIGERQKEDAWQTFEKVLAVARTVGATRYVFHGPAMLLGALKNAHLQRIAPIASELADLAARYNVRLCWENVSWCMFSYPDFGQQILQACPNGNLGFTLDIKQALRSRHDPFDYLDAMGDRLAHVHLCDATYDPQSERYRLFLPGEGSFDFAQLERKLREINYQGMAMIEVYSDLYRDPQQVVACCHSMREIMNP